MESENGNNGESKAEILLAQWQTCVEMANAVSSRRDTMNNLFVTLNLAIIAAISFLWDIKTLALSGAGLMICVIWILFIKNFKELNSEKYKIINEMEMKLPIQAFKKEWTNLQANKKYIEGTKLEIALPLLLCVIYVAVITALLITHFNQIGGCLNV